MPRDCRRYSTTCGDFYESESPENGRWWARGSRASARARPNRTRAPRGCESHGSRAGWPRPSAHRPAPVLRTGRACSQPHRGVSRWGSWLVLACSTAQRCTPRLAAYLYAFGQWYAAWSHLARSSRSVGPWALGWLDHPSGCSVWCWLTLCGAQLDTACSLLGEEAVSE